MAKINIENIDIVCSELSVAQIYNKIISDVAPTGNILAVGDSARDHAILNMQYFKDNRENINAIGINIVKSHCGPFNHFEIKYCNAHNIEYPDGYFDSVLSIMMLEHDPEFWLSVNEMKRVLKNGGSFIIGIPGFVNPIKISSDKFHLGNGTICYENHGDPDCYRFSPHAFEYFIFKGMDRVRIFYSKLPPRLIGTGYKI